MPKKGELSKTARASLANRKEKNHQTEHLCADCNESIWLVDLFPVKRQIINEKGKKEVRMFYYHKDHYKVS